MRKLAVDREAVKELWLSGLSASRVAQKFGMKGQTVETWVARYQWKRKCDNIPDKSEAMGLNLSELSVLLRIKLAKELIAQSNLFETPLKSGDWRTGAQRASLAKDISATAERVFPDWAASNSSPTVQFNLLIDSGNLKRITQDSIPSLQSPLLPEPSPAKQGEPQASITGPAPTGQSSPVGLG